MMTFVSSSCTSTSCEPSLLSMFLMNLLRRCHSWVLTSTVVVLNPPSKPLPLRIQHYREACKQVPTQSHASRELLSFTQKTLHPCCRVIERTKKLCKDLIKTVHISYVVPRTMCPPCSRPIQSNMHGLKRPPWPLLCVARQSVDLKTQARFTRTIFLGVGSEGGGVGLSPSYPKWFILLLAHFFLEQND